MFRSRSTVRVVLVLLGLLAGCGSELGRPPLTDPLLADPTAGDPWFGTVGNVLISDRDFVINRDGVIDQIWIGFNRPAEYQGFLDLREKHGSKLRFNIGGRVIENVTAPMGFYFDPNTTIAAELFAEATMTTLDQMKLDPARFALNEPGHWNVPAVIEKVVAVTP